MSSFKNPAWLPFSVSEAASAGDATGHDLDSGQAWNHLLDTLRRTGEVLNVSRATGKLSASSLPIPTRCDPCPGKRNASFI